MVGDGAAWVRQTESGGTGLREGTLPAGSLLQPRHLEQALALRERAKE